ncbi:MAG TPA: ABC transporter permease [Saprospiraceae bacterium]|nr:ABC transporter permease [Saprospiraceae bacterium]
MNTFFKVILESIRQAYQSLVANKLRTFLSLLGIVIGIFCIIAIKSAVDSFQDNIVNGFSELGSDVVYIDKMPWDQDPGENYWKYAKRPDPSYEDYEAIMKRSKLAKAAAYVIFTGGRSIKYRSNLVSNAFIMGSTYEYPEIQDLEMTKGRYFTNSEYETGSNKVILGAKVAEQLFNDIEPINKEVKLFGQKFLVIGVLKEEGESMFNFINFDEVIWVGYNSLKKYVNVDPKNNMIGQMLNIKMKPGKDMEDLKYELAGILRASRSLKPTEKDDFALNTLSLLTGILDSVFGIINLAGGLIGAFALLVGMISVANIMFVSVKERTSLIGVKKALGAKRYMILLEFLIEAIFLCILGGIAGLILVYVVMKILTNVFSMDFALSYSNIMIGIVASVVVGIISGVVPAIRASRLDPVVAMRS